MKLLTLVLCLPLFTFAQSRLTISAENEFPVLQMNVQNLVSAITLPDSAFSSTLSKFGYTKKHSKDVGQYYEFSSKNNELHIIRTDTSIALGLKSHGKISQNVFSQIREELQCCNKTNDLTKEEYEVTTDVARLECTIYKSPQQYVLILTVHKI